MYTFPFRKDVSAVLQRQVSIIKVSWGHPSVMRITKMATATAVDMTSNIGGTLGLFCGFSLLSLVEIIYWVGRAVKGAWGRGKEPKDSDGTARRGCNT